MCQDLKCSFIWGRGVWGGRVSGHCSDGRYSKERSSPSLYIERVDNLGIRRTHRVQVYAREGRERGVERGLKNSTDFTHHKTPNLIKDQPV